MLFSTLYKLDQAEGLWQKVFVEMSKVGTRGNFTHIPCTVDWLDGVGSMPSVNSCEWLMRGI